MFRQGLYDGHNLVLFAALQAGLIALLWLASNSSGWVFALVVLVFAFLGLTNYALLHEACHAVLHSDARLNRAMGVVSAWMFPVSFTFMAIAHRVHHVNNRTDHEMFDYYYPDDNRLVKYAQWYSILIGIYPPIIPLGSVLMAVTPWLFWLSPWQRAKSSSIIFDRSQFPARVLNAIRLEVLGALLWWWGLFSLLQLDAMAVLIAYAAFWFNWSTRQYVTHAFSPRDVMNGAHNLKVSPLMAALLLNGHWDLVHHQHPRAHWQQLPALGRDSRAPIAYWPQYLRQWRGPRPNVEPAPQPIRHVY